MAALNVMTPDISTAAPAQNAAKSPLFWPARCLLRPIFAGENGQSTIASAPLPD